MAHATHSVTSSDLVIEDLLTENIALQKRLSALRTELDQYREMLSVATEQLHDTIKRDRQRELARRANLTAVPPALDSLVCRHCQAANRPGVSPTIEILQDGTLLCNSCGKSWRQAP